MLPADQWNACGTSPVRAYLDFTVARPRETTARAPGFAQGITLIVTANSATCVYVCSLTRAPLWTRRVAKRDGNRGRGFASKAFERCFHGVFVFLGECIGFRRYLERSWIRNEVQCRWCWNGLEQWRKKRDREPRTKIHGWLRNGSHCEFFRRIDTDKNCKFINDQDDVKTRIR